MIAGAAARYLSFRGAGPALRLHAGLEGGRPGVAIRGLRRGLVIALRFRRIERLGITPLPTGIRHRGAATQAHRQYQYRRLVHAAVPRGRDQAGCDGSAGSSLYDTGILLNECDCDADGACAFNGSWNDPVSKDKVNARMTTRWSSRPVEVFETYAPGPDGKESKMMEITCTRKQALARACNRTASWWAPGRRPLARAGPFHAVLR